LDQKQVNEVLLRNVAKLSKLDEKEQAMMPAGHSSLPSVDEVLKIVRLTRDIIFNDYFHRRQTDEQLRGHHVGVNMEELYGLLCRQIARGLQFCKDCSESDVQATAEELSLQFIDALPEVKRLLYTDVEAMFHNDPAATNYGEVIYCYPVIDTMTHYRLAHALHQLQVPVIPRIITEQAHSKTGIDIHPGATIGEYFSIDHGTGVVIGETCVIGRHVKLYQGVTLGARSFPLDENGNPIKGIPRHPILEDDVIIYSNATILGRITIGRGAQVGGNIWVTHDVPAGCRVVQSKAKQETTK
jgi:serine O-acetyltransferase